MLVKSVVLLVLASSYMVFSDGNLNIYTSNRNNNPFMSLLHDIVKVNENRVSTLKKNVQLQDYIVSKGRLLTGDDEDREESVEDDEYVSGHKYDIRRSNANQIRVYLNESELIKDLRRNWMGPCIKRAAKACRTACINSAKDVCATYSCSRPVKRRFRRECRRNCNNEFKTNSYYSDYDSD